MRYALVIVLVIGCGKSDPKPEKPRVSFETVNEILAEMETTDGFDEIDDGLRELDLELTKIEPKVPAEKADAFAQLKEAANAFRAATHKHVREMVAASKARFENRKSLPASTNPLGRLQEQGAPPPSPNESVIADHSGSLSMLADAKRQSAAARKAIFAP